MVEIVRGADTSDGTLLATKALAERFMKTVICSQDFAGFIVNRILMPMINEARNDKGGHRHRDEARNEPSNGSTGAR
ncbi:unnamed protein product [Linum trigynum]|uniref:Uncharacterized protein n=1 Tax=Linum trigynum TaxID=586398 RepID=A0AAV2GGT8_9ROSI